MNGRVSLFTSIGFGCAGMLIVYVLSPVTSAAAAALSPAATELIALLTTAVLFVDLTLTVTALYHFDKAVIRFEEDFNSRMESLVDSTVRRTRYVRRKLAARGRALGLHAGLTGRSARAALSRVSKFRYSGKGREKAEALLKAIKEKTAGR